MIDSYALYVGELIYFITILVLNFGALLALFIILEGFYRLFEWLFAPKEEPFVMPVCDLPLLKVRFNEEGQFVLVEEKS